MIIINKNAQYFEFLAKIFFILSKGRLMGHYKQKVGFTKKRLNSYKESNFDNPLKTLCERIPVREGIQNLVA